METLLNDLLESNTKKELKKTESKAPAPSKKQTAQCVQATAGRDSNTSTYTIINEIHISY